MRVLVIELSNLGDVLLTYPALHALWGAYTEAEFHVLASPRTAGFFALEPRVHRVWVWRKKAAPWSQLALVARLAASGFNLVVDFRNTLIPLLLLGARRTPVVREPAPNGVHRAQVHLKLVTDLGIAPHEGPTRLPFGPEEEKQVGAWLDPARKAVVLVPGARSHLKRWSAAGFAEVADRLIQEQQAQVFLVGEEAEQPIAGEVAGLMREKADNLTGRTTAHQLAALLARARLVVTNDNACLHAAEVTGVPCVAIFGPTDERKYGPRHPGSVVIRRNLICAPCEKALCMYNHECMKWVTADEVYTVAAKILAPNPTPLGRSQWASSKDLFSEQASRYAQFRPTYPEDLFQYVASLAPARKLAWDCGCGNGQAAVKLADYFERVVATDPSEKQLENGIPHPGVVYRRATAGNSGLEDGSVDLVIAAQAFHWFEAEEFYKEVQRVSRPGAVLAVWCYGLAKITPEVDTVVQHFYGDLLGPYWEKERKLVEEGYSNIPFPFREIAPPRFQMAAKWSLDQLVGYLGTWSALQAFIERNGRNPLESLRSELEKAWGNDSIRSAQWELAMRIGTIHPSALRLRSGQACSG